MFVANFYSLCSGRKARPHTTLDILLSNYWRETLELLTSMRCT